MQHERERQQPTYPALIRIPTHPQASTTRPQKVNFRHQQWPRRQKQYKGAKPYLKNRARNPWSRARTQLAMFSCPISLRLACPRERAVIKKQVCKPLDHCAHTNPLFRPQPRCVGAMTARHGTKIEGTRRPCSVDQDPQFGRSSLGTKDWPWGRPGYAVRVNQMGGFGQRFRLPRDRFERRHARSASYLTCRGAPLDYVFRLAEPAVPRCPCMHALQRQFWPGDSRLSA
ncbi:hypothetical protein BDV97DRAFT_167798 [Delphinella strobiligena]|nr:hypothetical protein BDV97DRAFT_167798 [Delphinella strobiligena]